MKTDLASLKTEFVRLSAEIRKFDLATAIPTAQRKRVEKHYRELKDRLTDLQKRLDSSFAKVSSFVRQAAGRSEQTTTAKKATRKRSGPARKKVSKKVSKKASPKRSSK